MTETSTEPTRIFEIIDRIHVIGKYMDNDIHEFIVLEDERVFEYESIAVEIVPRSGVYYTDDPDSTYMLINGNLLYRQV